MRGPVYHVTANGKAVSTAFKVRHIETSREILEDFCSLGLFLELILGWTGLSLALRCRPRASINGWIENLNF